MRAAALLTTVVLTTATVACDSLTDVPPPSNIVDASELETQAAAIKMYGNGVFTFARAFGGGDFSPTSYVAVSGTFADEFTTSAYGAIVEQDTHADIPANENLAGPYEGLQTARQALDVAISNLRARGETTPQSYLAEMFALKGYVSTLLSELYCSGVPMSSLSSGGLVTFGAAESRTILLTGAVAQFDSALVHAGDSARIAGLAAVGRGRAYLELGDFAKAKASVASVPSAFSYKLTYAQTLYQNFYGSVTSSDFGYPSIFVANQEGQHGLDYLTSGDPRVPTVDYSGLPIPAKYNTANAPVTLASGLEARLIEAEVALHDGDIALWANTLNALRDQGGPAPMTELTTDSTTAAANDSVRLDVTFRERAFWLFAEGHRAGDMRRLVRQYGRKVNEVYPTGLHAFLPAVYVPTANLQLPDAESRTNPEYHGCLDRDA